VSICDRQHALGLQDFGDSRKSWAHGTFTPHCFPRNPFFQVSVVATIVMVFLLLPLYRTTKCDPLMLGLQTCLNQLNLTDFEQLTIANVPTYSFSPVLNGTTAIQIGNTTTIVLEARDNPLVGKIWIPGLTGRYVAPALIMLIITVYTCCKYFSRQFSLLPVGII
jgi:hypothetical protein